MVGVSCSAGSERSSEFPRPWVRRALAPALLSLAVGALLAGSPSAQAHAIWGKRGPVVPAGRDLFVSRLVAARPAAGWSSLVVRLQGGVLTPSGQARLQALGSDIYRRLPIVGSVALRVPSRNLAKLAALPFVAHLSSDGAVRKCDEFTVASSGAAAAWQQYKVTGQGVTVAVVDSGINSGQDLNQNSGPLGLIVTSRLAASVNFVAHAKDPSDQCGHGTHVAGIIGGNGSGSTGLNCYHTFYGIAPQANLVNVRVLDGKGQSNVSTVVSGIQWVVQNKAKYNIRVMNLSLGHPVGESCTTDPLCQAVEAAWKAGIVVVCAAGNEGRLSTTPTAAGNEGWGTAYGSIQSPGNDPYVITVGAMKSTDGSRADDRIATYSSRGPSRLDLVLKPDLVAPGNKIISLEASDSYLSTAYGGSNHLPYQSYCRISLGGNSSTYFVLSGTSMASPVVAGAAALLLQSHPNLTPDTIKARLMVSADKWTDPQGNGDPCTYGAGYLNIPAALQSSVVATQPTLSPTLSEDANGNVYINLDHVIWGMHCIWGTNINDLHVIWGMHCIWGTNTLSSSHVIWGTSVWNDHVIWGTSGSAVDLSSVAINGE